MCNENDQFSKFGNLPIYKYKQQEIKINNLGKTIFGIAYIPDSERECFPLVICSHGLGDSYSANVPYALEFAKRGIASFCFDFCGGGGEKSDGDTTKMSIFTEVSDLEVVINSSKTCNFVDANRIILLGHSQGGVVTAIASSRHKNEILGEVLLSPAFSLTDEIHRMFHSLSEIPEHFHFLYIEAGKPYAEDIWNYDLYSEIGGFDKKALIIHGNKDDLVPFSYSEKASQILRDAKLCIVEGAGHEFNKDEIEKATAFIFQYFHEIGIIQ